ncbi:MAG: MBL fold metallo-hydrolase [Gemmatimonadaceae bacterium]
MDRHQGPGLHADRGHRIRRLTTRLTRTAARAAALAAATSLGLAAAAPAQHPVIPRSLTADSATRAALASRYPRDRSDTLPAFPLRQLAPGVYAVLGDTGRGVEGRSNAGFVVTSAGVVVIDALASPGEGRVLLRTIRSVTQQPVRYLVLTHHHPDHTFGAIVFKRAGARIIAHPDRRTLANIDGDDRLASDWTGVMGLEQMRGFAYADTPDIPVRHDTALVVGGRRIAIVRPGAAHTAGDLMVWLPDDRVLFAGDVLVEDGVSMMVDGSSAAMLGALARIDSLDPRVAVPGHGRLATQPATLVAATRCYVLALRDTMRRAVAAGVRMGQAIDRLPPADRDRPVSLHSRLRRNAVRVYSEMEHVLFDSTSSNAALVSEAREHAACPR